MDLQAREVQELRICTRLLQKGLPFPTLWRGGFCQPKLLHDVVTLAIVCSKFRWTKSVLQHSSETSWWQALADARAREVQELRSEAHNLRAALRFAQEAAAGLQQKVRLHSAFGCPL